MPSTVVLASRYGLPLDTPPEFVWGYADTMRMDSVRPSCMECVEKHLGAALVLMGEAEAGYPEHKLLAIGHLHEAAEESADMRPELSALLRDIRKSYQQGEAIEFETILEALNQHGVWRFDQRGQGVACGKGWIPRSKKCSPDKAKQTSKEAKAKTVEKSKARAELKRAVKAERPSPEAVQAEVENIQKGALGSEGIANLRKRFFESNTPDGKSARRQALTMAKYSAEQRGTTVDQEMDFIVKQAGIPTKALAKFSVIEKNRKRLKAGKKTPPKGEPGKKQRRKAKARRTDSFLQGYLEVISRRFDQETPGQGQKCGGSHISQAYVCRVNNPGDNLAKVDVKKVLADPSYDRYEQDTERWEASKEGPEPDEADYPYTPTDDTKAFLSDLMQLDEPEEVLELATEASPASVKKDLTKTQNALRLAEQYAAFGDDPYAAKEVLRSAIESGDLSQVESFPKAKELAQQLKDIDPGDFDEVMELFEYSAKDLAGYDDARDDLKQIAANPDARKAFNKYTKWDPEAELDSASDGYSREELERREQTLLAASHPDLRKKLKTMQIIGTEESNGERPYNWIMDQLWKAQEAKNARSDAFLQGYLDVMGNRFDQRGQGVACGKGWIPRSKKCSPDKAKQTSKEAKAKTVEKSKARAELKRAVKEGKGQKARVKEMFPTESMNTSASDYEKTRKALSRFHIANPRPGLKVAIAYGREPQVKKVVGKSRDGKVVKVEPETLTNEQIAKRESTGNSNLYVEDVPASSVFSRSIPSLKALQEHVYPNYQIPGSKSGATVIQMPKGTGDVDPIEDLRSHMKAKEKQRTDSFLQGYLEVMSWRFDRKGEGVACGRGWISRRKKCGRDKSRITSPEAKARTVEKQKVRQQLRGQVKAAKGQKPYVKPKPEPDTPQKYPTRLPKDHVVTTNKRITAARIDKALNAIDSPGAKERVGMFRAFVAKTGVQSVFADPSASLTDHLDVVERGLKDKRYASQDGGLLRNTKADPTAAGYTTFLWNHVVITSDSRGRDGPFAASSEKLKQSADRIFEANAEDELTRDVMAFPFSVSGSVRDRDSSDMMTYIHEMGHQVHAKAGLPAVPMTIKGSATNYGAANEEEWFAEHFALWMLDAPRYEQLDPAGAQFIRDSLTKATESPVSVEELMARGKV